MLKFVWPVLEAVANPAPGNNEVTVPAVGSLDIILNSSPMVLLVLLVLASFSLLTWAIIYSKWKTIGRCNSQTETFLEVFWSGRSMDHIYTESKKHLGAPLAKIFQAGYKELQRLMEKERQKSTKESPALDTSSPIPPESSIQNLERAVGMAARNAHQELESSMTFLATTASTAPFIGLFGTVWGIMNSFQNIGVHGGASLEVVAPGIAEALIATAVGLGAAIPATMAYNYFNQKIRALRIQMENFAGDFLNIVKRNFLAS